jgi:hypothetical protein
MSEEGVVGFFMVLFFLLIISLERCMYFFNQYRMYKKKFEIADSCIVGLLAINKELKKQLDEKNAG